MEITFDKCKVLTPSNDNTVIHGELLENVNNFAYLGSSAPDTTKDIERRIALALKKIHLAKQRHPVKIEITTLLSLDTTNRYLCIRHLGCNR